MLWSCMKKRWSHLLTFYENNYRLNPSANGVLVFSAHNDIGHYNKPFLTKYLYTISEMKKKKNTSQLASEMDRRRETEKEMCIIWSICTENVCNTRLIDEEHDGFLYDNSRQIAHMISYRLDLCADAEEGCYSGHLSFIISLVSIHINTYRFWTLAFIHPANYCGASACVVRLIWNVASGNSTTI